MRRPVVVGLVAMLLLAGCGGLSDQGADEAASRPEVTAQSAPSPRPTPSPTPTAAATPAAESAATPTETPEPTPTPSPTPELVAGPPIWGLGSSGDDVRELQARLAQIDWFDRDPTGYYGDVTAQAVSGFQAKRGFPVVGYVDQRTWDRLASMTTEPTRDELYPPTPTPTPAAAPAASTVDARCLTGRVICIDKSQRVVRWVVDGSVQLTLDARFGSELTPTREGVFSVQRKVRDEVSQLYNTSMPLAVYFSGGQAVHYSPDFAANGYNGSSHGCVNTRSWGGMSTLFDAAHIGDRVVVYWS